MPLFYKNAAAGANAYLAALTAGEESRGRMWAVTCYLDDWKTITSAEGKALSQKIWQELEIRMTEWELNVKIVLRDS